MFNIDRAQTEMISEELEKCAEFYQQNGVNFPNLREALAMDYREFYLNHWDEHTAGDEPDWQELTDIWLANNFSQQELEGEL